MRWAVVIAMIGCDDRDPCAEAAQVDEPTLTIGIGENGFDRALEEGDILPLVSGSQGGQHVFLAVQTAGFNPGRRLVLSTDQDIPTFHVVWTGADDTTFGEQWIAERAMKGDPTLAELALGEVFVPESWGTGSGDAFAYGPPGDLALLVEAEDACGTLLVSEVGVSL